MNKISYFAIVVLAISPLLTACGGNQKVKVQTVSGAHAELNAPTVDRIIQNPVHFYAIAKDIPAGQKGSIEDFWKYAESKGYSTGLVLSPDEYQKIVQNNQRLRKFILQNKALQRAYVSYIKSLR